MGFIRLLLAISVVLSHSNSIFGFKLVGGDVAVQSFFIISGFYMALVINNKYFSPAIPFKRSYKLFITNRFLKLYPVYWVILIATIAFSFYLIDVTDGKNMGRLELFSKYPMKISTMIFLVFTNIGMFFQDTILFLGFHAKSGGLYFIKNFEDSNPVVHGFLMVPQAWSVGIELVFYVLAPFILRKGLKLIVPILLLSFLARLIMYTNGFNFDPWTTRFLPFELGFFLLGAVAYHIYKYLKDGRYGFSIGIISFITMTILIISYGWIKSDIKIFIYYGMFFLLLPYVFEFTKKSKIDRFLGDLSYPIYISHLFVLLVIQFAINIKYEDLGIYLTLFSILLSIILQFAVVNPIEKYRQKRVTKSEN
jgi:peptidoglycan/LPS O-acetylase OafA/YrhL